MNECAFAVAVDRAYLPAFRGFIGSVLNVGGIDAEIMHVGVPAEDRVLQEEIATVGAKVGLRFNVVPISASEFEGLPVSGHVSNFTYARLALFDSINAQRLVYFDTDVLLKAPVEPLTKIALDGLVLGAVRDLIHPFWDVGRALPGLDMAHIPYFNAGVLVVDLVAYRLARIGDRARRFLRDRPHNVGFWDQDALNFALKGQWFSLDQRWNAFPYGALGVGTRIPYRSEEVVPLAELQTLEANCFVLHFVGRHKPWSLGYPSAPLAEEHRNMRALCCRTGDTESQ